ncbi:VOC family protein [Pseudoroseicyclus tamaricis]|uniref:VOC family protein n=1 Tax=Pseudoroseicyclus tamaricis TaxID=2705421 RepID=A0A6B2JUL8_9RHOB|nr:VOC family protein [Pseudoroseicyclus tamaricis]NDV01615.1 VOC family protein [Pseudoroseicyclus tamaricis]
MPVHAIGGVFFRARDPDVLADWYARHLGVGPGLSPTGPTEDRWAWQTEGGPVVFAPFRTTSDYFGPEQSVMLNFRVSDLDGMMTRLADAGIAVETRPEWNDPQTGRFARIQDPEGNAIELWEPPPPTAAP